MLLEHPFLNKCQIASFTIALNSFFWKFFPIYYLIYDQFISFIIETWKKNQMCLELRHSFRLIWNLINFMDDIDTSISKCQKSSFKMHLDFINIFWKFFPMTLIPSIILHILKEKSIVFRHSSNWYETWLTSQIILKHFIKDIRNPVSQYV